MAYAALVISAVVAAAASAYSTYEQHEQEQKNANYNEKIQRQNAMIAQDQARAAAEQERRRGEKLQHQQIAAYGASGVQVGAGSPLEILSETGYQTELDAQRKLYEGAISAYGSTNKADYFRWVRKNSENTQWTDTLIKGISSGVATYAKGGGEFGNWGGAADSGIDVGTSKSMSTGAGASLFDGATEGGNIPTKGHYGLYGYRKNVTYRSSLGPRYYSASGGHYL